jgi:hypothetical protein
VEYAAAHIQHMQKALMEMNLQLHHVLSDITGATGMRIIQAIVSGERDPEVLRSHKAKAVTATARKIAVLFYNTLTYGMTYRDPGADHYEQQYDVS